MLILDNLQNDGGGGLKVFCRAAERLEASYFFLAKNPSTLLANSSENPNRALARE
jgi:hypothetical protein